MEEVKFTYDKDDASLTINYNKNEVIIYITKESKSDLNDLYDYIIQNINEIEFVKTYSDEEMKSSGVAAMAALAIVESIENETEEIKKDLNKFVVPEGDLIEKKDLTKKSMNMLNDGER